jgi:hypothetical protein
LFPEIDGKVDVTISGLTHNVDFVQSCIVKMNEDRSVCQKFAYGESVQVMNNLLFKELYAIEIELELEKSN